MKCRDIENLLTHYIDNELTNAEIKALRKHIQQCPGCAAEYAYLKKYKKSMSSLQGKTAPSDFLRNVHYRIENKSLHKRIVKKLFSPFYIKIPIEAASIVVTTIIIIIFVNRTNLVHKDITSMLTVQDKAEQAIEHSPLHPESSASRRKQQETSLEYEKNSQRQVAKSIAQSPRERVETDITSTLLEEKSVVKKEFSSKKDINIARQKSQEQREEIITEKTTSKQALQEENNAIQTFDAVPLIQPETHTMRQEYALKSKQANKKIPGKKAAETARSKEAHARIRSQGGFREESSAKKSVTEENHTAEKIKDLTLQEKGKITHIQHSIKTNHIRYIMIQIPYNRYDQFMKKLTRIVKISNVRPRPKPAKDGNVTLKIQFIKRK